MTKRLVPARDCGERGIRTLEGFDTLHAFQACAIDHYATSPYTLRKKSESALCWSINKNQQI